MFSVGIMRSLAYFAQIRFQLMSPSLRHLSSGFQKVPDSGGEKLRIICWFSGTSYLIAESSSCFVAELSPEQPI